MDKKRVIDELYKPARKNFKRRNVIVFGICDLFQADLVDLKKFSRINKGYNYILTVIDVFSKFPFVEPLKKNAKDVTEAFKKILKNTSPPRHLQTDDGKEFFNSDFKKLMEDNKINHYSTYSVLKASVVERFNRTIKNKIWKKFALRGEYKYIDILPELIREYNNTIHRTIKMKPKDVNKSNEKYLLENVYNYKKKKYLQKLKKNDKVRISRYKKLFQKGYEENWSNEIFIIDKEKYMSYYLHLERLTRKCNLRFFLRF